MKTIIITIALAAAITCGAQKDTIRWRGYAIKGGSLFAAGMIRGFNQTLMFRYKNLKDRFPGLDDQFWNPEISWRNKYRDGDVNKGERFPLSTTLFVWTTDGYHLTNSAYKGIWGANLVFTFGEPRKKWYVYLAEGFFYYLCEGLGFNLFYTKIVGGQYR